MGENEDVDSPRSKIGHELLRCVACTSSEVRPVFYIFHEDESFAYNESALYECSACNKGIIQRLDYDSFDWEDVWAQYEWYVLEPSDLKTFLEIAKRCPSPNSGECICEIHGSLRKSLYMLPRSSWNSIFEKENHIHRVALKSSKDRPVLLET